MACTRVRYGREGGICDMKRLISILALLFLLVSCSPVASETSAPTMTVQTSTPTEEVDPYGQERQLLIEEIKSMGVKDEEVLRVMAPVPRHKYVLPDYLDQAYANHPLPIGYGQTISQPYIVAWMTELLELQPGEKVLEIGTGSGYQAAVLAALGDVDVYTIWIVPELAERAGAGPQGMGY